VGEVMGTCDRRQREERSLDDFGESGVDVHPVQDGPSAPVRGVEEVDDFLDQNGGVGTARSRRSRRVGP
jgi:hypothetical protein